MAEPALQAAPTRTRPVLKALRQLEGRATVADVVADTGLSRNEAETTLRELLEGRRGHLEVGQEGTLVYSFDPALIRRDAEPLLQKVKRVAWRVFKAAFKAWIVIMLVVYFVVFVALLIAAVVAGQSRDEGGGGLGGGRRRGGHGHFPSFWFWYLFWTPDWRWGRPYYGHRWESRGRGRDERPKVPFYKKVFAFVFGPDTPTPTQEQKDRSVIRLIRARQGVLTAAELVQHTGASRHEAEEELARLMTAHDGDVKVTPDGELTYVFPELMVSAHGRVEEREPDPAWRRLEPPRELTGNTGGTDALIGGINGFNLVAAGTAPLFIFPRLGFSGDLAWIGLVWVPVAFSLSFFAVPALRWLAVKKDNAARRLRNVRKVLLARVFEASLVGDGAQPVRPAEAAVRVKRSLEDTPVEAPDVEDELVRLTAEFDGQVGAGPDGGREYRFPEILRQFRASDAIRRKLALEERGVGEIVYSSEDSVEEAGERELEAFDREIERERSLERYLQAPDRVDYVDDFELVAFEEEMRRRGLMEA